MRPRMRLGARFGPEGRKKPDRARGEGSNDLPIKKATNEKSKGETSDLNSSDFAHPRSLKSPCSVSWTGIRKERNGRGISSSINEKYRL